MTRLNNFIRALDAGTSQVVGVHAENSDHHRIRRLGESDLDFVWLDMEHVDFDFPMLGESLQWLISRRHIRNTGDPLAGPTPLVRVPTNASEHNQWIIKHVLDYGAFGIVQPRVQTADQAASLVRYSRYPQGLEGSGPEGERGFYGGTAARYWGTSLSDYVKLADLWPLNPDGEVILKLTIEDHVGVKNIEDIVKVPGIGALIFGQGDLSLSMLGRLDPNHPDLRESQEIVLRAARKAGVAVGTTVIPQATLAGRRIMPGDGYEEDVAREFERGFQFVLIPEDERPNEVTSPARP
ncbi:HpcH/HpaI aldolase/citrate lyase family protein [Streptomyces sp. NPDC096311]|uniref:HpcH/HpaI aldolase family protein n=1 Tax=Streptomyces sp. NPDC096311 TaxID=3366083 RepID=UPI0038254DED